MAATEILFDTNARGQIAKGVDALANVESGAPAALHRNRVDVVLSEDALDRWESDGGTIVAVSRAPGDREDAPCLLPLALGYHAQPAWGFRDPTGRFSYEFNRVYGPPQRHAERRPTCRLDRDLSYWGVTWSTFSAAGEERAAGRWMTYAQARALPGSHLTFERFSSLIEMRDELPRLLLPGGQDGEPP